MDIPEKYRSIDAYRATVGHKINHSFTPNCVWGNMLHPVFGRIPSITALTDIKTGRHDILVMERPRQAHLTINLQVRSSPVTTGTT